VQLRVAAEARIVDRDVDGAELRVARHPDRRLPERIAAEYALVDFCPERTLSNSVCCWKVARL